MLNEVEEAPRYARDDIREAYGGPDLLTDAMLEETLEKQPQKFTLHCTAFLLAIFGFFAFCKWLKIRLSQGKYEDTQLDVMMKRQILESNAFKNSMQHYENNICV